MVLRFMQAFDMPHDKVQRQRRRHRHGPSAGRIGAMILGTVLDEFERRDLADRAVHVVRGMGMGTATIIERV